MKTSEKIREVINAVYDDQVRNIQGSWFSLFDGNQKAIRSLEKDYKRAVRREKREAGTN